MQAVNQAANRFGSARNAGAAAGLRQKYCVFVGNADAGGRGTSLLALIGTTLGHGLDVWTYLKAALDELQSGSSDYHAPRPDVCMLAHPEFIRTYRI